MTKEDQIKTIETLVDYNIDAVFTDVHNIVNTKSGDITPEQAFRLSEIKKQLVDLINEQVQQINNFLSSNQKSFYNNINRKICQS